MKRIKLSDLIAKSFYTVHNAIKGELYTHYWLKGGRGSTKSSFVSIEVIKGMMKDPEANAVAIRKVGNTLKDSVYTQLLWAIEKLGVEHLWDAKISPMELTYIPTGQKILFRGADQPKKIKSLKFKKGYPKFIWYEEVDQFGGPEEIRTLNQSLMRGGDKFLCFYSYNPPESQRNWVNGEVLDKRPDKLVHHSCYKDVPRSWLGEAFLAEAEHLERVNPKKHAHEYMGEVTGTGGEVFTNVTIREITDKEIAIFDQIRRGIDFGYAVDPFAYGEMNFDKTRRRLYIFHEIYKVGLSNRKAAALIRKRPPGPITADSAEPKSIDELKEYGLRVKGAKKGPDSVDYGIKFLQDLEEIIIDINRCPNAAKEFLGYELERDGNGDFKAKFPDTNNHFIDLTRYALEDDMGSRNKIRSVNKRELGL